MRHKQYRWVLVVIISSAFLLLCAGALLAGPLRENVNLPGMDYRNFSLPSPDPKLCEQACTNDPKCMAFTYVKPGSPILIQGYGFPSYPEVVLYDPTGGVIETNPCAGSPKSEEGIVCVIRRFNI